jgi:hypothetical protein
MIVNEPRKRDALGFRSHVVCVCACARVLKGGRRTSDEDSGPRLNDSAGGGHGHRAGKQAVAAGLEVVLTSEEPVCVSCVWCVWCVRVRVCGEGDDLEGLGARVEAGGEAQSGRWYLMSMREERQAAVLAMAVLTAMRPARLCRPSERPSVDPELNPNHPNLRRASQ